MAGKYRYLDHVSDAYVECEGGSVEEAFESAGVALFNLMTDIERVEPKESRDIEVEGEDLSALLFEWLSELLYRYDAGMMYYSKFEVHSVERHGDGFRLKATIWGEKVDRSKHPPRTEVKAATYSLMEIKRAAGRVIMRYVVDI
ncbi:MAG: archease [Candidatus Bathyarchaeia archaeon]